MTLVEAAVETFDAACAAERAGADRVELCSQLEVGGITPAPALIRAVKAGIRIPVFVLVRPRPGDFSYSNGEISEMRGDIELAIAAAADGIVTGALTPGGRVDIDAMGVLIEAANRLPMTFHRAFDRADSHSEALEDLAGLKLTRVLTAGGAVSASEGMQTIADLVRQSAERIQVVAGGGVREHNVEMLLRRTRVREVHARLIDETGMRRLVDAARAYDSAPTDRSPAIEH